MSTAAAQLSPSEVAVELIGRDYLSYSAVSTYQQCPLKFYFKYIQQIPEDTVSAALVFGGAIHSAVEFHFDELMAGNPAPDLDTLLYAYQHSWMSRDQGTIKFGKTDDVDSLGRLAERMLTVFSTSDFAKLNGAILGVEEELRGGVFDSCPDLLGRMDLLIETSDDLVVTDLKTSRSRWTDDQAVDAGDQLLCYSELVRSLVPGKSIKLRFLVITKTKEPTINEHFVPVYPRRVARTKGTVERVWQSIVKGIFYPAPSAMNCGGCPFRGPCREWRG